MLEFQHLLLHSNGLDLLMLQSCVVADQVFVLHPGPNTEFPVELVLRGGSLKDLQHMQFIGGLRFGQFDFTEPSTATE